MTDWPKDASNAGSRFALDCAHRVINDRDPSLSFEMRTKRSDDQLLREEEGVLFEYNVRTELVALHNVVDLGLIDDYQERTEATLRAIKRGDAIIVGAALPASEGRSGAPDILVKGPTRKEGANSYFPVDIKNHNPLDGTKKPTNQIVSSLKAFTKDQASEVEIGPGTPDSDDSLILSHYWRLLESLGYAPEGEPFGGIIGPEKHLVWRSLDLPLVDYDKQFKVRLAALMALIDQKPPHTKPIWNPSWCDQCHWREHCKEKLLTEQHVSLIKGVSYTKAVALESAKPKPIRTWVELANATAEDLVIKGWPRPQVEIDHARARLSGSTIPFTPRADEDFSVPRADVEIDFDMESIAKSEANGRLDSVYLWGTLTKIRSEKVRQLLSNPREGFYGFSIFENNKSEAEALSSFWTWVQDWISKSVEHNFSLKFYCYHGAAENTAMKSVSKRANGKVGVPALEEIEEFKQSDYWIDIEDYVKKLIWPTENQSLKTIGKIAGAKWEEGANGALSTVWFDTWTRSLDPAERDSLKNQLLEYNTNDVEATLIIRDWINDGLSSNPPKIVSITSLDGRKF
jgi:predicted RecB family nuclease